MKSSSAPSAANTARAHATPRTCFIQTAAHEPCNRLFNSELGPGGWDNINIAHFANIARALDDHRGEGRRFVITYGAGHKEWFMRALRARDDVTILDLTPFLRKAGAT